MFGLSITTGKRKKEQIKFLEGQLKQARQDNAAIATELQTVRTQLDAANRYANGYKDGKESAEREVAKLKEKIAFFKSMMSEYQAANANLADAAEKFEQDIRHIETQFDNKEEEEEKEGNRPDEKDPGQIEFSDIGRFGSTQQLQER